MPFIRSRRINYSVVGHRVDHLSDSNLQGDSNEGIIVASSVLQYFMRFMLDLGLQATSLTFRKSSPKRCGLLSL